ncbi:MAG: phosphoesterase, partial [Actinoallomurus sp.]
MNVTRQRVAEAPLGLFGRLTGSRIRLVAAGTAALAIASGSIAYASTAGFGTGQVGQTTAKGQVVSSDQYIKPIGQRLVINNGKIMSSTVSPDGTHVAASVTDGGQALVIVDLKNWKVQQTVGNSASANLRISSNAVGQEGPTYSPDGSQLWLGQTDGFTKFTVNPDGTLANPTSIKIPADGPRHALVAEPVFSPDGKTAYVAVNGQNRVVAIDAATGAIQQSWDVGNAPRGMVKVGNKLYVSNEGGRPAKPGETTINSYGTQVPADPNTGATTTGTVSVIDLANPAAAATSIDVGLHPTALYAKNGALFVTNTATNNVSVIDTSKDKVVQTIATQPWPEASVGYEPTAVTLTDDGHLLVTLGRANAVAVYRYTKPLEPVSYVGLLPTDYFPAEIATVGNQVLVSNTRGI